MPPGNERLISEPVLGKLLHPLPRPPIDTSTLIDSSRISPLMGYDHGINIIRGLQIIGAIDIDEADKIFDMMRYDYLDLFDSDAKANGSSIKEARKTIQRIISEELKKDVNLESLTRHHKYKGLNDRMVSELRNGNPLAV